MPHHLADRPACKPTLLIAALVALTTLSACGFSDALMEQPETRPQNTPGVDVVFSARQGVGTPQRVLVRGETAFGISDPTLESIKITEVTSSAPGVLKVGELGEDTVEVMALSEGEARLTIRYDASEQGLFTSERHEGLTETITIAARPIVRREVSWRCDAIQGGTTRPTSPNVVFKPRPVALQEIADGAVWLTGAHQEISVTLYDADGEQLNPYDPPADEVFSLPGATVNDTLTAGRYEVHLPRRPSRLMFKELDSGEGFPVEVIDPTQLNRVVALVRDDAIYKNVPMRLTGAVGDALLCDDATLRAVATVIIHTPQVCEEVTSADTSDGLQLMPLAKGACEGVVRVGEVELPFSFTVAG